MSQSVQRVCDQCRGVIPSTADRIQDVMGTIIMGGAPSQFPGLDFCCTQHMVDWIQAHPNIAVPNPPYPVAT